ncbi:MAG TPA: P1 family peptidase [Candidatus Limnocylindrales bacterium]|nr:P1 family peptidase [Candidatus Limnocylindrales bacterium]
MTTPTSAEPRPAQPAFGGPAPRPRPRELGVRIGRLPPGPTNSIVDVHGISVGHASIWRDEPGPPAGRGTARTGVSAIVPFDPAELFNDRVAAGAAVLNGAGEMVGITSIGEWGVIETPIFLTSSMAIGRVYDAAVELLVERVPNAGIDDALMPVVAECDDGYLNATRTVQVQAADVRAAVDGARGPAAGPVAGGVVGAGVGMRCFDLKGGIGNASRVVPAGDRFSYHVGVLALTNFGRLDRLTIDGVPIGAALLADGWPVFAEHEQGSCIVVVATDAPLLPNQLTRLARRAGLGLARAGSTGGHGSGEIFVAISTAVRSRRGAGPLVETSHLHDGYLDPFLAAVVEASEEAVVDSLFVADTVTGRDGHRLAGLPVERTLALLEAAGRLGRPVDRP